MEIPINVLYLIPALGALALVGVIAYDIVMMLRDRNRKIQKGIRFQNA